MKNNLFYRFDFILFDFRNEMRMKNAIRSLIANPQNNLRVFHNGILAYSNDYQDHDLHHILSLYFGNSLYVNQC